jgi:hypothetical protein
MVATTASHADREKVMSRPDHSSHHRALTDARFNKGNPRIRPVARQPPNTLGWKVTP